MFPIFLSISSSVILDDVFSVKLWINFVQTPAKNTNVGDKSLENQMGDPWKKKKKISKKLSDLNKNRLKNSKKIF